MVSGLTEVMTILLVPASSVKSVTVAQFQTVPVLLRVQVVDPMVKARTVAELEENTVDVMAFEFVVNPPETNTIEPLTVREPTK